MPAVKSAQASADKWGRVTPQRAQDYKAGVSTPKVDWASATADASEAHTAGVEAAIANDSFKKGVVKAGSEKWKRKASTIGAARFGPGVQAAKAEYQQGVQPYLDTIANTTLPPRGPKGDPRNYERSQIIGDALHKQKTA